MNCKKVRKNLRELARGELGPLQAEALAHLDACTACAAEFENERQLNSALRDLAAADRDQQPRATVEHTLQAAFRSRGAASALPAPVRGPWRWAAVAAGVVMAVVALYAVWHRIPPTAAIHAVSPPAQQQSAKTSQPEPPIPRTAVSRHAQKPRPVRHRARKPAAQTVEVVTAFYPVPYAEPFRPEETQRVVRVRVPQSALVQFGLPVSEERAQEPINADVLVGEDNLPRAIRLVGDWRHQPSSTNPRRPGPVNASFKR